MSNKFNQQNHPEKEDDEVFLTNTTMVGHHDIGWLTKRIGEIAFDKSGTPIISSPKLVPVFVKREELKRAGVLKNILKRK